MMTTCGVELIRWPRKHQGPHEVTVRVLGLIGGPETLNRRLSNLRRAKRVARAIADGLGCRVQEIDMRHKGK